MKRISLILAVCLLAIGVFARQPQRGYRGFIDWDNNLTSYTEWTPDNHVTYYYTGVSTSHGYQFNPNFYLGAGLSLEYNKRSESYFLPLYLQARTDQKFGKFTPFGDLRLGYSFSDGGGLYVCPTIGYRFNWGRKFALNLGVGVTVKCSSPEIYNIDYAEDSDGYLHIVATYMGREHYTKLMFAFRAGIEF